MSAFNFTTNGSTCGAVRHNVSSEEDSSDKEDGDVDDEAMTKLLNALGEDGLDEIGKMQLEILEEDAGSSSGGEGGSEEGIEEAAGSASHGHDHDHGCPLP